MNTYFIVLTFFVQFSICRDFYVGMFKKNDFLVAQDRLYKERRPYTYTTAKYGRMFKCPITFFRVVDRLGIGNGPRVQITRGGLMKKFLVLQITSPYNQPISANIYVGCSSVKTTTTKRPISDSEEEPITEDNVPPEKPKETETQKATQNATHNATHNTTQKADDIGTTHGKTETSAHENTTQSAGGASSSSAAAASPTTTKAAAK